MEMTQLNTRIPCNLKASGDAVLARFGRTASDVMRCVWQYMADHQDLPECAKPQMNDEKAQYAHKCAAIDAGSSMVAQFAARYGASMTQDSRAAMWKDATAAMLAEYEALDA